MQSDIDAQLSNFFEDTPPREFDVVLRGYDRHQVDEHIKQLDNEVRQVREQTGGQPGAIARVADQLGIHREALRGWVRQAEVDQGDRPGVPSAEQQRIAELERENRELRRANEILKAASAYFAAELDRPRTR